jgi:hypothetical protein
MTSYEQMNAQQRADVLDLVREQFATGPAPSQEALAALVTIENTLATVPAVK